MHGRRYRTMLAVAAACVLAAGSLQADVKKEERTQFKFEGMLGRMVGLFGGKAAREGIVSTVALKGDRRFSSTGDTGELVDLAEERVYEIDMKKKTYRVVTFDEMRRQMREAAEKAERAAKDAQKEERERTPEEREQAQQEPQVEIDFDLKESGQRRAIAGHDAREVVMTVAVRQKGQTLEQGGGLVLISNMWLGPEIQALERDAEFERRYAQKLYGEIVSVDAMQQMAAAMAMYPGLKDAMQRMSQESVNMEGTPLLTTMTMQSVKSEQQMTEEKREASEDRGASGGVGGMLARRVMRKKESPEAAGQTPGRATILTSTTEVLKISTDVSEADVALPAGFKQVR
jgi:hypothetical protein